MCRSCALVLGDTDRRRGCWGDGARYCMVMSAIWASGTSREGFKHQQKQLNATTGGDGSRGKRRQGNKPARSEGVRSVWDAALAAVSPRSRKKGKTNADGAADSPRAGLAPPPLFVRSCVEAYNGDEVRLNCAARIFMSLEDADLSRVGKWVSLLVVVLIVGSTVAFVISTLETFNRQPSSCTDPVCDPATSSACTSMVCAPEPAAEFGTFEEFSISLFTIEYMLRVLTVWSVPTVMLDKAGHAKGKYAGVEPGGARRTYWYVTQSMNLIDIAAILPFYIALVTGGRSLGFLRVTRLARVMRVFKLGRYSEGSQMIVNTMRKSSPALGLLMFFMMIMMVLFGSLIYFFESGTFKVTADYPEGAYFRKTLNGLGEEVSPFTSIPLSFYWVVITTCTIGYGDFYPTSPLGRTTASLAAYCGILCVALPVTIVGTNFQNEYYKVYSESNKGQQQGDSRPCTPETPQSLSLGDGGPDKQKPNAEYTEPSTPSTVASGATDVNTTVDQLGAAKGGFEAVPTRQSERSARPLEQQISPLACKVIPLQATSPLASAARTTPGTRRENRLPLLLEDLLKVESVLNVLRARLEEEIASACGQPAVTTCADGREHVVEEAVSSEIPAGSG